MNKNIIFTAITTVVSGGVGAFIGFFIGKKKYEKKITQEVEAVEAHYKKNTIPQVKKEEKSESTINKKIPVDKSSIDMGSVKPESIKNYNAYFNTYTGSETSPKFNPNKPYIISQEEYANSEYDTRSLYLFDDGILADEDHNIIEDIAGMVGNEAVNSLLSARDGTSAVYVRNERYKLDYEILRDNRFYGDVAPFKTTIVYPED